MTAGNTYDVAIIGGGLAGLSCAILLARRNYSVVLLEKEKYPFHKVCGEYISLESFEFVQQLGVNVVDKELPIIKKLQVSAPSGKYLLHTLPLGGFGISRFQVDYELMQIARKEGVEIIDGVKANNVDKEGDLFTIDTDSERLRSRIVCAAFGKRSNLDVKWNRSFIAKRPGPLNHYIAVKYHARIDHPRNLIALHNFDGGYCGISPIEEGKSCICYLTTAYNLKRCGNDIQRMEEVVLSKNPLLKGVFDHAQMLYDKPLTISQVSFHSKKQFERGILFMGDAASMIAPLCGNGMSMALLAGRMASEFIPAYLDKRITLDELGKKYSAAWNMTFGRRMKAGRMIQRLFGNEWLTSAAIGLLRWWPGLLTRIIRQTHGDTQKSEYSAG